jgi:hypothetical protein
MIARSSFVSGCSSSKYSGPRKLDHLLSYR